jgi:hypothetical protein
MTYQSRKQLQSGVPLICEGELQMDIKRKTCDIQTWKKHLFLDISYANIDTLVPLLPSASKPAA